MCARGEDVVCEKRMRLPRRSVDSTPCAQIEKCTLFSTVGEQLEMQKGLPGKRSPPLKRGWAVRYLVVGRQGLFGRFFWFVVGRVLLAPELLGKVPRCFVVGGGFVDRSVRLSWNPLDPQRFNA